MKKLIISLAVIASLTSCSIEQPRYKILEKVNFSDFYSIKAVNLSTGDTSEYLIDEQYGATLRYRSIGDTIGLMNSIYISKVK